MLTVGRLFLTDSEGKSVKATSDSKGIGAGIDVTFKLRRQSDRLLKDLCLKL